MIKSGDSKDNGGYIQSAPVGRTWKFKHAVTLAQDDRASMIHDYTETGNVYSQSEFCVRKSDRNHAQDRSLTAGEWYAIKLEYYENSGGAVVQLMWDLSGGKDAPVTIPATQFMPPAVVPTRTLYIGGLYEEEVTNQANPPYTVYYSFIGKLVGMRRANHQAGDEQFRMVGDHLGSTTLILDTATTPNVLQRQYHKPYGETAWQHTATSTGGESLTNIGYTGQRSDEVSTGLMFYNAKLYDPVLGFFVSADTIAPQPLEARTNNRYSYVLNDPVNLTDPTGHTPDVPPDNHTCKEDDRDQCER
jgi:RHS repeat-associated protein